MPQDEEKELPTTRQPSLRNDIIYFHFLANIRSSNLKSLSFL